MKTFKIALLNLENGQRFSIVMDAPCVDCVLRSIILSGDPVEILAIAEPMAA